MIIKFPIREIIASGLRTQNLQLGQIASQVDLQKAISYLKPVTNGTDLIRIGGDWDGGYLIPDDLAGITTCFSPGVGSIAGFEDDISRRFKITSFMADHSVEGPPSDNPEFRFQKKYIGSERNDDFIDFEQWVIGNAPDDAGDLLLQMDIEGGEYDTLMHASKRLLQRFRIISLELHGLHRMFSKGTLPFFAAFLRKITEQHDVVHLHPNNCSAVETEWGIGIPDVMEVTLHRKDRARVYGAARTFPHPLDQPNTADLPDIALPAAWF